MSAKFFLLKFIVIIFVDGGIVFRLKSPVLFGDNFCIW